MAKSLKGYQSAKKKLSEQKEKLHNELDQLRIELEKLKNRRSPSNEAFDTKNITGISLAQYEKQCKEGGIHWRATGLAGPAPFEITVRTDEEENIEDVRLGIHRQSVLYEIMDCLKKFLDDNDVTAVLSALGTFKELYNFRKRVEDEFSADNEIVNFSPCYEDKHLRGYKIKFSVLNGDYFEIRWKFVWDERYGSLAHKFSVVCRQGELSDELDLNLTNLEKKTFTEFMDMELMKLLCNIRSACCG